MADDLWRTISAKAWPVRRGHANARPRRRPAKSRAGGLAACRCNNDDTAACFVDYISMLARVLCVLFFLLQSLAVSEKRSALGSGSTHAHRTERPTHALHNEPRRRRLTAFA